MFPTNFVNSDAMNSLYVKARVLGHKRAKRNTRPNTTLVQIEGVENKEAAQFYLGKVGSSVLKEPSGIWIRGIRQITTNGRTVRKEQPSYSKTMPDHYH